VGSQIPEIIFDTFGKHHGYVIFTWAEETEADVTRHLTDQLEEMKNSHLWNSQGRFIIMVTGHHLQNISHLAVHITQELWNGYKTSNVLLILIPKVGTKICKVHSLEVKPISLCHLNYMHGFHISHIRHVQKLIFSW
jgi:hypothetical protein